MVRVEVGERWDGVGVGGGAGGVEFAGGCGADGRGVSATTGVGATEVGGRVGVGSACGG